ncbi:MAG: AAA-like domain-containing protein, partial [Clostridiales Family XIII bacterium]|jgi:predicted AAA+ superfamily ATPase|nr:AAA-like domain-containing protein [Clostridiales Family XIII bacterium]
MARMKKRFNTTGLCIPEQHYMVDISERVAAARAMVDRGDYFTINRPRQYGKTTMHSQLRRTLSDRYVAISTSFEGVGDRYFESEEKFCKDIFFKFANDIRFTDEKLSRCLMDRQPNIFDFETLSFEISELANHERRGIVLLIDEVDKSSNSKVFLQFLGLLRKKYLARERFIQSIRL